MAALEQLRGLWANHAIPEGFSFDTSQVNFGDLEVAELSPHLAAVQTGVQFFDITPVGQRITFELMDRANLPVITKYGARDQRIMLGAETAASLPKTGELVMFDEAMDWMLPAVSRGTESFFDPNDKIYIKSGNSNVQRIGDQEIHLPVVTLYTRIQHARSLDSDEWSHQLRLQLDCMADFTVDARDQYREIPEETALRSMVPQQVLNQITENEDDISIFSREFMGTNFSNNKDSQKPFFHDGKAFYGYMFQIVRPEYPLTEAIKPQLLEKTARAIKLLIKMNTFYAYQVVDEFRTFNLFQEGGWKIVRAKEV